MRCGDCLEPSHSKNRKTSNMTLLHDIARASTGSVPDAFQLILVDTPQNVAAIESFLNRIADFLGSAVQGIHDLNDTDPRKVLSELAAILGVKARDLQSGRIDWSKIRQADPESKPVS